jgi:polysaccharide chain length determinant protein (PEP-CTERM system associated)
MQDLLAQLLLMLRGAWRYRWPALALTWVVALAGWLAVASMPDSFEARTRVYVDTESLLKPLLQGIAVNRDVMSQVAMMQAVMLSRPNLEKVARQTDLFLRADSREDQERVIDSLQERIVLEGGSQAFGRVRRAPVSNQFMVSFEDSNPKSAHRVVQSLLDTFMEDSLGMKRSDAGVAERFLRQQLSDYERKLLEAESRLAGFKKTNVGLMPGTQGDYYERLDQTMGQLDALRTRYRQVSERRNELARQLQGEEPTFGLSAPVGSAPIDSQIASYQARIDQMLLQYTEKHPEIVALRDTIARLEEEKKQGASVSATVAPPTSGSPSEDLLMRSLDMNPVYQSMKIAHSQAEAELAEVRGQISAQEQAIGNLRSRMDAIPEVEAELARLNRDYVVNKAQYDQLLQRLESARISERADQSTEDVKFRVIEPPTVPVTPSGPERALLSALVLLASLGTGLGFALLLQQVRPVFSTKDTLRQVTGLPVLGSVTAAVLHSFVPWYRRQTALVSGALAALAVAFLLNLLLQQNVRAVLRNLLG